MKHLIILFTLPIFFQVLLASPSSSLSSNNDNESKNVTTGQNLKRTQRWSIFYPAERSCQKKCKSRGNPFSRLLGTVCSCFCPRFDLDTCNSGENPSCSAYCRSKGYKKGGDCVNGTCFCILSLKQSCPFI